MSISSSDFSKHSLAPANHDQRADRNIRALHQSSVKESATSADSNKTGEDSRYSQKFFGSIKVDPQMVEDANKKMSQMNVQLSFEVSKDKRHDIVKVVDQATGKVVRQIPTEEFLKMSERIDDMMSQLNDVKGALLNSKA